MHPAWEPLGSIPQHVTRVAHEPVALPLLLPELLLVLLPLPELLEVELHWLSQFDVTQLPTLVSAVMQADSISLVRHAELVAALDEYVPPGHAQET
jgi:hypothetical protein